LTKIYLIRHAESEGNVFRRAHGHYNGLVTPKGDKQIELLKESFKAKDISAVYSSDLARTMTTALGISVPRELQIIKSKALREVNLGVWEDRPWGDIDFGDHEMIRNFNNDPANWSVRGCEPFEKVGERIFNYISQIAEINDGNTIVVCSHGFAIRSFLCLIRGIASHETNKIPYCDNTAVTLLSYDKGVFSVDYAGDNSHLGTTHSTLERQSWWRATEKVKPENLRFLPLNKVASESLIRIFQAKAGRRAYVDVQYAAFLSDEPIGIIGLDTFREETKKIGWISYLHVIPHRRNSSFGTQLLGLAVSDFRRLKREKLRIELTSGSPGTIFMSKCGFKVLITTETYCHMEKEIKNW